MRLLIFLCFILAPLMQESNAQQTQDFFTSPTPIEMVAPIYPRRAAQKGEEGWVILNFMVDTDGNTFEPSVAMSTGNKDLEEAAITALQKSKWVPAKLASKENLGETEVAIEGGASYMFRFELDGDSQRVRRRFNSEYRKFGGFLSEANSEAASSQIKKLNNLGALNNFEYALLSLANYDYHRFFDPDETKEISYLISALGGPFVEIEAGYLPEELSIPAKNNLFMLLVNSAKYQEALDIYYSLRGAGADTTRIDSTVEQIHKLAVEDSGYSIKAKTDHNGEWQIQLFKAGFYINGLGNRISEIRLRCDKKFQFFQYKEDVTYQVPRSWGKCNVQVLASANIDFEFGQFGSVE